MGFYVKVAIIIVFSCIMIAFLFVDANIAYQKAKFLNIMNYECSSFEKSMDAKEYFENGVKKFKEEQVEQQEFHEIPEIPEQHEQIEQKDQREENQVHDGKIIVTSIRKFD